MYIGHKSLYYPHLFHVSIVPYIWSINVPYMREGMNWDRFSFEYVLEDRDLFGDLISIEAYKQALYGTLDRDKELSFLLNEEAPHVPETTSVHPRVQAPDSPGSRGWDIHQPVGSFRIRSIPR